MIDNKALPKKDPLVVREYGLPRVNSQANVPLHSYIANELPINR